MTPVPPPPNDESFRWQSLFQKVDDPLFVLSRRRRLLFVNRAWEGLTGVKLAAVKGQACRHRPREVVADQVESILSALAPPPEALQGKLVQIRRHIPALPDEKRAWNITFLPLLEAHEPLAVLGRIEILTSPKAAPSHPLPEKVLQIRDRAAARFSLDRLIGEGPALDRLRAQIRLASQARSPALILGPRGAGKRSVARAIHERGPQRTGFFASFDCSRLPGNVIADLLFSADFRQRNNIQTVYLKEPGRLSPEYQAQLARWLSIEDVEDRLPRLLFGVRTEPGEQAASSGLLPELECRASTMVVTVPPLIERIGNLPAWVEHLLPEAAAASEKQITGITPETMSHLSAHTWPGNLAELFHVLHSACVRAQKNHVESGDLPFYLHAQRVPAEPTLPLDKILHEVEKRLLTMALRLANNNKSRAAELLSIWRPRLLRRMEALGIADTDSK